MLLKYIALSFSHKIAGLCWATLCLHSNFTHPVLISDFNCSVLIFISLCMTIRILTSTIFYNFLLLFLLMVKVHKIIYIQEMVLRFCCTGAPCVLFLSNVSVANLALEMPFTGNMCPDEMCTYLKCIEMSCI